MHLLFLPSHFPSFLGKTPWYSQLGSLFLRYLQLCWVLWCSQLGAAKYKKQASLQTNNSELQCRTLWTCYLNVKLGSCYCITLCNETVLFDLGNSLPGCYGDQRSCECCIWTCYIVPKAYLIKVQALNVTNSSWLMVCWHSTVYINDITNKSTKELVGRVGVCNSNRPYPSTRNCDVIHFRIANCKRRKGRSVLQPDCCERWQKVKSTVRIAMTQQRSYLITE